MRALAFAIVLPLVACGGGGGATDTKQPSLAEENAAFAEALTQQMIAGTLQPAIDGRATIQLMDTSCGGFDCSDGGGGTSGGGGTGSAGSGGSTGEGGYGGAGWGGGCSTSVYAGYQTCCVPTWGGGRTCYLVKDPNAPYAVKPGDPATK